MSTSNEDKKLLSFSTHIKRLVRALEKDDNIYIDYLTSFVEEYPPSTSYDIIKKNEDIIKSSKLLDLVIANVLPATFASLFLKTIKLLSYVEEYELEIYASDGVSKILYAMKENITESEIQILGCQIISYLTLDDAVREALGEEEECIKQIISTISQYYETSSDVLNHAFRSLTNICFENNLNKQIVLREGLNIIMSTAKRSINNPVLLTDIMIFVRNIVNNDECKYNLKEEGLIEFLIDCLKTYKDTEYNVLLEHLLWVFIIYITGSDSNKEEIVDNDFIPVLLSILQHYTHPIIINNTCILLFLLSKLSKTRKELTSLNGIAHIIELFDHIDDISCIESACRLLDRLSINKKVREEIVNNHSSIIAKLLHVMKNNVNSMYIHSSSVKVFLRLLTDRKYDNCIKTSEIIKANQGISTLVASMNTHQNESLKNRICDILNILLTGPEDTSGENDDNDSNESDDESNESNDEVDTSESSDDSSESNEEELDSEENENNLGSEENEIKPSDVDDEIQKIIDHKVEIEEDILENLDRDNNIEVSTPEINNNDDLKVEENTRYGDNQQNDQSLDNKSYDIVQDYQPLDDENINQQTSENILDTRKKQNEMINNEQKDSSTNEDPNLVEMDSPNKSSIRPKVNDLIRRFSSSESHIEKKIIVKSSSNSKINKGKVDSALSEPKEVVKEQKELIDESADPKTKIRNIFSFWKEKAGKK